MRGNDWFPLHFDRLRKSKWWRRASDTARARNVMLWGEAYKAQPAGSLPDDDDELAEAAGYGMDVDAFLAVKAEILSPWTLCSDGRWYHPTLCEVVLDAWERLSERRRREAEKKRDQRVRTRAVPAEKSNVPRDTANVPGDAREKGGDIGTQDKTGHNPPNPPRGGADEDEQFEEAFAAYPESGRKQTPPAAGRAAWDRERAAGGEAPVLIAAIGAMAARPPERIPRFDNWLRRGLWRNYVPQSVLSASAPLAWTGPGAIRAAVVARKGEAWARAWLDPTRYQEVPEKALLVTKRLALTRLREEVGSILAEHGIALRLQEVAA